MIPTPSIPACKNCRHFYNDYPFTLQYGKCRLTRTEKPAKIDPIDNHLTKPIVSFSYASINRSPYGDCGYDGKLHECETNTIQVFRNCYSAHFRSTITCVAFVACYIFLLSKLSL